MDNNMTYVFGRTVMKRSTDDRCEEKTDNKIVLNQKNCERFNSDFMIDDKDKRK